MKKCPYCGLKINDNILQCGYCNRELGKKQSAKNIMKKCPFCAEEIQDNAIKCRYCGEWLEEIETVTPEIIAARPPTYPPEDEIPFDPALPRPWNRFWARSIDYTLFFLVFYLIEVLSNLIGVSFTLIFTDNMIINRILNITIELIILIAFLVFFESIWISKLSTTPGKALFGIRVLMKNGEKLSYIDAVNRSFFVLLYGYALLIVFPVGPIIAMWYSLKDINKNGIFKWDKIINCHVSHTKLDPWRYWSGVLVGSVLFVILFASLAVLKEYNKKILKERIREKYGLTQKQDKPDFDAWEKEIRRRRFIR